MQTIETWDDLRYFVAVARAGKLADAARDLGVNHSTVFRRINQLEEAIGARLFQRDHAGYALTEAGREMFAIAERIEEDVLAIDRQVLGADRQPTGTVTMTTVEEVMRVVAPHLKCFRDQYPGIVLEVHTDLRVLSLARREADVAIRPGRRPGEPGVVGRPVVDMALGAYASTEYLQRRGRPRGDSDLANHWFVAFDRTRAHVDMMRWLAERIPDSAIVFRGNSLISQLEAVRAGLGIALLPKFMVEPDSGLERVMKIDAVYGYKLWILTHADLRHTARVRAFIDFIAAALTAERDRFEDTGPASSAPARRPRSSGRARRSGKRRGV